MQTMMMRHPGHESGRRAPRVAPVSQLASWRKRTMAPAFHGCGTTRVDGIATGAYLANPATDPATTDRPARHLGSRST